MKEITVNVTTGEESSRNFTAEEVALANSLKAVEESVQAKEQLRHQAKASLIEKLQLTAEEAKLLLS